MGDRESFFHLHCHQEYSQLDGMGTAEQYAKRASEIGQKFLGKTDHGNADGFLKFQSACLKYDITPIFGTEYYIVPDITKKEDKRHHIIALVRQPLFGH